MSGPYFGSDPWIDAQLRNVPLPVDFLARLSEVRSVTSEQLDVLMADVPLPPGFLGRLERIARSSKPKLPWRSLALAASVLLTLGLSYIALLGGFLGSTYRTPIERMRLAAGTTAEPALVGDPSIGAPIVAAETPESSAAESSAADGASDAPFENFAESPNPAVGSGDLFPIRPRDLSLSTDRRINLFGSNDALDSLPELESVLHAGRSGVTPPLVRGYDMMFQLKHGDHPFVSPAAHKDLQTSRVPLVADSTSFERALYGLRQGRLPAADDVRVEEFLAAMDYAFPPPSQGALALRTAAGVSPLGEPGLRMLQVGVQAGALARDAAAVQLTIAVDTSASMQRGGRLNMVRRGLSDLTAQLAVDDRLTLVSFNDRAEILVEDAGRDQQDRVRAAVGSLAALSATNVGAGLELACSVLERTPADRAAVRRLILVTDGLAELDGETAGRIEHMLRKAASVGVQLWIVDLGGQKQSDDRLAGFAKAAAGRVLPASGAARVRSALLEAATGRSQVVASGAVLTVTFNPLSVAAYRLLGHEAVTLTGDAPVPAEVDLRALETATALYELWLKPTGGDDVATAELSWREPDGRPQQTSQRVSRLQFAKSFAEGPSSLQAAAIAVETAEVLRGSYFAPSGHALIRLKDLGRQVDESLAARPALRQFMFLIEQAQKLRSSSPASRGAAGLP